MAASRWQSSIGRVQPRSSFAVVQSLSMTGTLMLAGSGMVVAGVIGLGSAVRWGRGLDSGVNLEWAMGVNSTQANGLVRGLIEKWAEGAGLAFEQIWARGAWKWVGSVDWREVAEGAELAGREGWQKIEDRVSGVDLSRFGRLPSQLVRRGSGFWSFYILLVKIVEWAGSKIAGGKRDTV